MLCEQRASFTFEADLRGKGPFPPRRVVSHGTTSACGSVWTDVGQGMLDEGTRPRGDDAVGLIGDRTGCAWDR